MATRPVYIVTEAKKVYVTTEMLEFKWFPGFATSQKLKSIRALHNAFSEIYPAQRVLEVSSKSPEIIGNQLSAFNLKIFDETSNSSYAVENAFQAGKVFSEGGPYLELLRKSPLEAKKYIKLQTSGELVHFQRNNIRWQLEPKTVFYDWIYLNALYQNKSLTDAVMQYEAFTDIEFNPKKSYNCQAYSVALFVSLNKKGLLKHALSSPDTFKELLKKQEENHLERQLQQTEFML